MRCRHRKRTIGQGIVEFAIVGPIFFLMLLGTVEMGRMMWINHELSNGAREGARWASVRGELFEESNAPISTADVRAIILDRTSALADGNLTVTLDWSANGAVGSTVTVTTRYRFEPLIGGFLGISGFDLNQQSVMTVHY